MAVREGAIMRVLRDFGKAFNAGDVDGILACVTDDFEWRQAMGPDAPDGRIVKGKQAVRAALAERDRTYKNVRYSETSVHMAKGNVFGCFRAIGAYADGRAFDVRGVDIYVFRDGKIALKDSYWKQVG